MLKHETTLNQNALLESFSESFTKPQVKIKKSDDFLENLINIKKGYSEKIQIMHKQRTRHAAIVSDDYASEFELFLNKFIEKIQKDNFNMQHVDVFLDEFFINQKLSKEEQKYLVKKYPKI